MQESDVTLPVEKAGKWNSVLVLHLILRHLRVLRFPCLMWSYSDLYH